MTCTYEVELNKRTLSDDICRYEGRHHGRMLAASFEIKVETLSTSKLARVTFFSTSMASLRAGKVVAPYPVQANEVSEPVLTTR